MPARALVGYWHNFENGWGFIRLRDVSRDFDVINLSFGEPVPGSRSQIQFVPDVRTSAAEIQADVAQLKSEGKKVLLSIGGANGTVELNTETDKQNFIDSVSGIVTQYGLNGIDVDFEGSSVTLNAGDLDLPQSDHAQDHQSNLDVAQSTISFVATRMAVAMYCVAPAAIQISAV